MENNTILTIFYKTNLNAYNPIGHIKILYVRYQTMHVIIWLCAKCQPLTVSQKIDTNYVLNMNYQKPT